MSIEVKNLQKVREFYDDFSKKQIKTGVNTRHYYLFKKLIESGLKKDHNVLEIGCGIGTLTGLLGKFLKTGKIVATDISKENIKIAEQRLANQRNIQYIVSDMQDFITDEKFDFVVLADVLEHIPLHLHDQLFKVIFKCIKPDSSIFINIPHPKSIEYFQKNYPEKLQIIDQPIYAQELIKTATLNGFILYEYKSYSLFHNENDYVSVIFKVTQDIKFNSLTKTEIIQKKMFNRLYFWFATLK